MVPLHLGRNYQESALRSSPGPCLCIDIFINDLNESIVSQFPSDTTLGEMVNILDETEKIHKDLDRLKHWTEMHRMDRI